MEKEEREMVLMVEVHRVEAAIIDEVEQTFFLFIKTNFMAEHTKGQDPNRNREDLASTGNKKMNTGIERETSDRSGSSSLNEKSSTMGRREKGRGMATKDGVTGSDYDGQVTE